MASMDVEVRVRLSDAEIIERAQTMAAKVSHIEVLRKKKSDDSKNTQALIDTELDEVQRLARVICEQEEERRQGDLFAPTPGQAVDALANVAATAEGDNPAAPPAPLNLAEQFLASLGSERPEEHLTRRLFRDFCSDKGVRGGGKRKELWEEVQQLAAAAGGTPLAGDGGQPVPTEPHDFAGKAEKPCTVCGSGFEDPVHAAEQPVDEDAVVPAGETVAATE